MPRYFHVLYRQNQSCIEESKSIGRNLFIFSFIVRQLIKLMVKLSYAININGLAETVRVDADSAAEQRARRHIMLTL